VPLSSSPTSSKPLRSTATLRISPTLITPICGA
jgi:hypothetical protein